MDYKKIFFFLLIGIPSFGNACSMFKLSDGDRTLIGCNHDAWVTEPQLKFTTVGYGAAFTGATRYNGNIAPQSGMNEHGIVFTTLSINPPKNRGHFGGTPVTDRTQFLESVLQQCSTLEEVELYFSKYDRSSFIRDLFIYIDSMGRVLFVEPYLMHYSNDHSLVQSNFCPSEVFDHAMVQQERFIAGNAFISNGYEAEMDFGRAMIEEMSISRRRHGDGTLISTVWDNESLTFDVIFYHDFDSIKSFNLKEALLNGDTTFSMERMFPINSQFEELKAYKTPFNTPFLRVLLALIGVVSGILGLWYLIKMRSATSRKLRLFWAIQTLAGLLGFGYCFVLTTDIAIYYYDFPYVHPSSWWRTAIGFTPIYLLVAIFANLFGLRSRLTRRHISLMLSTSIFGLLLIGFLYWSF